MKKQATLKQKRAVKLISENVSLPTGKALEMAGYSKSVSESPSRITNGAGFLAEMARSGLTKKLIADSLVDDIVEKRGNRVGELALGAKILKMTSEDVERDSTPMLNIVIAEVRGELPASVSSERVLDNGAEHVAIEAKETQ